MSAKIRPATNEDVSFLAWGMLQAARGHLARGFWDIWLERPEEDCQGYLRILAQTKVQTWFHYSHFIVAEMDGRPAAGMCGYNGPKSSGLLLMQAMAEAFKEYGIGETEQGLIVGRFAPILTCVSAEPEDAWIIENVATLPVYRRRGLVDSLLHEMLARGRAQGYRLAQISVLIGNTPAQRAYEKVGFKVVDEKRHPDFERVVGEPGMRRLQREL